MSVFGRLICTVGVLSATLTFQNVDSAPHAFNDIRIVHVHPAVVCDSLLDRIKNNGYKYAVVPFMFRNSNEIIGDRDVYDNLRNDVCSLTVALNRRSLRLIPLIPMSSKWALQWKILRKYENPAIGMNTITSNDDLPVILGDNPICTYAGNTASVTMGSNSWANEPLGVDSSIIDVFNAVKDGFNDAKVPYDLEFVHLQHDEPQFLNWLLMAGTGADCGNASPYRGNFARGESSAADSAYIAAQLKDGHTLEAAYQRLLADELSRRVAQAQKVFGPEIRIMVYADAFDNQSWGGVPWRVNFSDTAKILMQGVIDLPGLDEQRKLIVKKKLIPLLWNYDGKIPAVNSIFGWLKRVDYDSRASFNRFAERGYDFLYIGAFQNGNDSRKQIDEFAAAAQKYPEHCRGFYAVAWDAGYDPQAPDPKWDIIEYMQSVQKSTAVDASRPSSLPEFSFSAESTRPLTLTISFAVAEREMVVVDLFTVTGRFAGTLVGHKMAQGKYRFCLRQNPGVYLVRLRAGNNSAVKRVTIVG